MGGDYLGTMAEQARGTYEPKHRADIEPLLMPVIIETTDRNAKVLRAAPDGRGVIFVPPGVKFIEWPDSGADSPVDTDRSPSPGI